MSRRTKKLENNEKNIFSQIYLHKRKIYENEIKINNNQKEIQNLRKKVNK